MEIQIHHHGDTEKNSEEHGEDNTNLNERAEEGKYNGTEGGKGSKKMQMHESTEAKQGQAMLILGLVFSVPL